MTNKSLHRRLGHLELKARIKAAPCRLLMVRFVRPDGKPGGEPCATVRAECDGRAWHRAPDETPGHFERRVERILDAERKGRSRLVLFFPPEGDIA